MTFIQQESIPVGCVPPAFLILGGVHRETPPPGQKTPQLTETPLDRALPTEKNPDRDAS